MHADSNTPNMFLKLCGVRGDWFLTNNTVVYFLLLALGLQWHGFYCFAPVLARVHGPVVLGVSGECSVVKVISAD